MNKFLTWALLLALPALAFGHGDSAGQRWVQIQAKDKFERSRLADLGMTIEFTRTGSVWGFADEATLKEVTAAGFKVLGNFEPKVGRGGHQTFDFPGADARYHNYDELKKALAELEAKNPDLVKVSVIGKSVEGRDIMAIHINSTPEALTTGVSNKPGTIFMGNHHAREHLSVEIPLMLAEYLVKNRRDWQLKELIESRDIWIIPMVNPDGSEYDISTSRYKLWRRNRRQNSDGTYGVDLNRNYGFKWGTGGSSSTPSNDTYKGPAPFSEPETVAIRDFVKSKTNTKTLLTFHTFSELILYPWGHSNDPISNARDRSVFETMAKTMAGWNKYTPEQSSDLYIASGDTVDWAYGELGIFAFTFELSPKGGFFADPQNFYPGAGVIDQVFNDNLKPCLYLLDAADDPYKVVGSSQPTGFLRNYVEPRVPSTLF